ncbi:hypothetical protein C815_01108 [Firmicutes bacterium M10-2]|nr:hypothetical protein C815_01108 [Firmicutes bacterium M10-2]
MYILIVEDEKNLAQAIAEVFINQKDLIEIAATGKEALHYLETYTFDLVILDWMLPQCSGIEVLQTMRERGIDTPVLMLSAKGEIEDKVIGLESGADDYMSKPFSTRELLARVKALTRRKGEVILNELQFEDLTLYLNTQDLSVKGKSIHLGHKEFKIIQRMMKEPDRTFAKEDLITWIWGSDSEAIDNNVEVYISFLRKKMNYLGSKVKIKTIRKLGYRLETGQ